MSSFHYVLFVILVPTLTTDLVLRPEDDDPPLLGREYELECKHTLGRNVDSSKFKVTYEWFDVLRKGDKRIVKERKSSISFKPFKLPDVGKYYCKVTILCEGKIVDEKETNVLDMASIGMITHISCLVISFLMHKYSATGFESIMGCFWCFCVFWLVFCELQVVAG